MKPLLNKSILITGGARRIGRELAIACAQAGASILIHHSQSDEEAEDTAEQIRSYGSDATIIKADFSRPKEAIEIIEKYLLKEDTLFGLINNASIFEPITFAETSIEKWQKHIDINLTMPFLLSQSFQTAIGTKKGRIINILDWRALRPGKDHFPYTISKSSLAAMTKALALTLSPQISVNGLALGAILPPSDGQDSDNILRNVPIGRWAKIQEVTEAVIFLLSGPEYITGEIIHVDGGRHLV